MFQKMYKALGLTGLLMVFVVSMYSVPSFADEVSGNSVTVENVHCSGGEGFALVMLNADPQASGPVAFDVSRDGVLYDSEQVAPGDSFGVSIGGLTPGTHTLSVTADNFSFSQEIQIVCTPNDSGAPSPVIVTEGPNFGHHHKKHHHKHHKKHHYTVAVLPNTGY